MKCINILTLAILSSLILTININYNTHSDMKNHLLVISKCYINKVALITKHL